MLRRPAPSEIPDRPGAYLFRDRHGEVLYVGKAKSLRKRLPAYFGADVAPRTQAMVKAAASTEWIVTENEVEALMVEYSLIQKHRPRFNIRLRDDKSYPFLAVTRSEEWPRATVMRGKRRKGTQYFGPYAHAYAIRETLDLLLRTFPVRTCSNAKFRRHVSEGRPCLLFHIERCCAPCVGEVTAADYAEYVEGLCAFLGGSGDELVRRLEAEMEEAAESLAFERAARLRDQVASLRKALARQEAVTTGREDFDLLGLEEDELEAALIVLNVRRGRITGRRVTVLEKVEELTTAELMARLISQMYGSEEPPPQVLTPELPEDAELWEEWLGARRGAGVSLRVPRRGAKRRLLETARTNAAEELARSRLRRHRDHNARARALRRRWGWPSRRFVSRPTTSPRFKAPTPWDRWWSWRTACRDAANTGASRWVGWRVRTTSPRWRRY
jgi:excinuclease ABC subunit C